MALVVRAFPVLEGMEESVREIARTMGGERAGETAEFFSRLGVRHESWHLQETPAGLWVIAVSDLDAPQERAQQYADSHREFDSWFKERVLELTGIDPLTQPLGPPTEEVFSWSAPSGGWTASGAGS
jgi:hypothetical protein